MIVVTGGAGMIGSNLIAALNDGGCDDIVLVDTLSDSRKIANVADLRIADFVDRDEFAEKFDAFAKPDAVFHLGACSSTLETDVRYVMRVNYTYSKRLLEACQRSGVPLIYASSASVYGTGDRFVEDPECERPLNAYAYSKWLFDCHVRRTVGDDGPPVAGLRYFNVYGPREAHKDAMASIAYQFHTQLGNGRTLTLFGAHDGFEAGQQARDFVHVEDAVQATLWCHRAGARGIFNCGTGEATTFETVAKAVIAFHGRGAIEYRDFPDHLKGRYQSRTCADLSRLRASGYSGDFRSVTRGVSDYLTWLTTAAS